MTRMNTDFSVSWATNPYSICVIPCNPCYSVPHFSMVLASCILSGRPHDVGNVKRFTGWQATQDMLQYGRVGQNAQRITEGLARTACLPLWFLCMAWARGGIPGMDDNV